MTPIRLDLGERRALPTFDRPEAAEARMFAELWATEDRVEAFRAALGSGAPEFKGR
jgi:hypothetical protein